MIVYLCFRVAGNGAYMILWHASLPEGQCIEATPWNQQ